MPGTKRIGWMDSVKAALGTMQTDDGGGCATMHEVKYVVVNPDAYIRE